MYKFCNLAPGQFHIIVLPEADSTNNYAKRLLEGSEPEELSVVRALFQTGGRGQSGNHWESKAGENLTFSIILYPAFITADRQFCLSQAVSLGICDYLKRHTGSVRIKWPNDVYAGNRKIAGILIENTLMQDSIASTVAGIGLNMNQRTFDPYTPEAVSLSMLTGKEYQVSDEFPVLLDCIATRYDMLKKKKFSAIGRDYLEQLYWRGETHQFEDADGRFSGMITGTGDCGELFITDDMGRKRTYLFKEVRFIHGTPYTTD